MLEIDKELEEKQKLGETLAQEAPVVLQTEVGAQPAASNREPRGATATNELKGAVERCPLLGTEDHLAARRKNLRTP